MKTYKQLVLGVCLMGLAAMTQASEQRVKMEDLPPAVQATVKAQSQGATLHGLSKEVENGKTLYEAEMVVNGHGKDVEIDSSGAVVAVEEEVALSSLPAAARAAIEKSAGNGKVLKVEAITHGGSLVAYEAQVNNAGKRSEVRVDPQGRPAPE
jgi:uncharacterized membrane protein YkoI